MKMWKMIKVKHQTEAVDKSSDPKEKKDGRGLSGTAING